MFGNGRRWAVFVVGLCCLVTGIGLSIAADLGVGSWQVFETGLAEASGSGLGPVILVEALVCLAVAWGLLGQRPWIATGVLALAGVGISAVLGLVATPASLVGQAGMLSAGMVLLAVGVAFYLAADLGASAQDALFVGIYDRFGIRPGVVRFAMDATLVLVGWLLGGQIGAGTIAVTIVIPLLIEPALRLGHRLAGTPPPAALDRGLAVPPIPSV